VGIRWNRKGLEYFFLIAVEDRTANTLVWIVKDKIQPGTTIYSDCWKSYETLTAEHSGHLTVNHSVNFVDPETGAHTQHIQRTWVEVRKLVPRFGRKKRHYEGYLSECLFFFVHFEIIMLDFMNFGSLRRKCIRVCRINLTFFTNSKLRDNYFRMKQAAKTSITRFKKEQRKTGGGPGPSENMWHQQLRPGLFTFK
jgi:transposase-like protein